MKLQNYFFYIFNNILSLIITKVEQKKKKNLYSRNWLKFFFLEITIILLYFKLIDLEYKDRIVKFIVFINCWYYIILLQIKLLNMDIEYFFTNNVYFHLIGNIYLLEREYCNIILSMIWHSIK